MSNKANSFVWEIEQRPAAFASAPDQNRAQHQMPCKCWHTVWPCQTAADDRTFSFTRLPSKAAQQQGQEPGASWGSRDTQQNHQQLPLTARCTQLLHSARCQSPATPSSKLTLWSHVSRSAGLASRAGHKGVVLELGDAKVAHLGAPSRVQQNILHKHRWWASHVVWVSADGCRAGPTHDAYRLQHYHPGLHHKCMACL